MGKQGFKRKEAVAAGVRRLAVGHIDRLSKRLDRGVGSSDDRADAVSEAVALGALIELVRVPLGAEVVRRERRWLGRLERTLEPAAGRPGDAAGWRALAEAAGLAEAEREAVVAAGLEGSATDGAGGDVGGAELGEARAGRPEAALLRRRADLVEARMRARHWHLPAGDFDLLAPGLGRSYRRARQRAEAWRKTRGTAAGRDEILDKGQACEALADALNEWGQQLRRIERAWPEVLVPTRKGTEATAREAQRLAAARRLRGWLAEGDADLGVDWGASIDRTDSAMAGALDRLLAESAAAMGKRLEAYWRAWRG